MPLPDNFSSRAFDRAYREPRDFSAEEADFLAASLKAAEIVRSAAAQLRALPAVRHWRLKDPHVLADELDEAAHEFDAAGWRISDAILEEGNV